MIEYQILQAEPQRMAEILNAAGKEEPPWLNCSSCVHPETGQLICVMMRVPTSETNPR